MVGDLTCSSFERTGEIVLFFKSWWRVKGFDLWRSLYFLVGDNLFVSKTLTGGEGELEQISIAHLLFVSNVKWGNLSFQADKWFNSLVEESLPGLFCQPSIY